MTKTMKGWTAKVEYIDREQLLKTLEELKEWASQVDKYTMLDIICDIVKVMPSVKD